MIEKINNIINKNIKDLILDKNIISIFAVGSMVSDDYIEKEVNDYDIRFIVNEMNSATNRKINNVLEKIQNELKSYGYGCEISDLIGPVKMNPTKKHNILLHAIKLTERDLNDLPYIHKYSYSCDYKMLYGNDLINKYKTIILVPNDIIISQEGIDYCIDMILNKKCIYNEWVNDNEKYKIVQRENPATYYDMIELFYYSYKKARNNIINMIKTNNIDSDLNNYLDFNEKEKLLVEKIENNKLTVEDIDININVIVSILLKLKKSCIKIYQKKKYYNSLQWGIINNESKNMRNIGFDFLKKIGLPTGNNFSIKFVELKHQKEYIKEQLENSNYLILFEPPNNKFQRFGINDVKSFDKIEKFIEENTKDFIHYNISFIEKIQQTSDSFAGTLISDGKGNTIIETIDATCDSRELTSTGVDTNRVKQYKYISFDDYDKTAPLSIKEIKEICQYFKGYYEFAYGKIRNIDDIYFTFYSSNKEYINIFEGGKIYGKTLRNR